MRSDYLLYIVSGILFVITVFLFEMFADETPRNVSMVATVTMGILFAGLGYILRPKTKTSTIQPVAPSVLPVQPEQTTTVTPPPATPEPQQAPIVEVVTEPITAATEEFIPRKLKLTKIRGIGEKRFGQLKALEIKDARDLAKASPNELATKLDIPMKTATRWIADAKELAEKA